MLFLRHDMFFLINIEPVPHAMELNHMKISKRDALEMVKDKISKAHQK